MTRLFFATEIVSELTSHVYNHTYPDAYNCVTHKLLSPVIIMLIYNCVIQVICDL